MLVCLVFLTNKHILPGFTLLPHAWYPGNVCLFVLSFSFYVAFTYLVSRQCAFVCLVFLILCRFHLLGIQAMCTCLSCLSHFMSLSLIWYPGNVHLFVLSFSFYVAFTYLVSRQCALVCLVFLILCRFHMVCIQVMHACLSCLSHILCRFHVLCIEVMFTCLSCLSHILCRFHMVCIQVMHACLSCLSHILCRFHVLCIEVTCACWLVF